MGYNTRYSLSWKPIAGYKAQPNCKHNPDPKVKFCPECGTPVGLQHLNERIADIINNDSDMTYVMNSKGKAQEPGRWDNFREDMEDISKQFRDVLFTLHGEGEESGDIWNAYFLNGKSQTKRAKVVIDEPDMEAFK